MRIIPKAFLPLVWMLALSIPQIAWADQAKSEVLRVAILGESFSSEDGPAGINEDILARLFNLIRKSSPAAVIFTGNMTLGLQKDEGPPRELQPAMPLQSKDIGRNFLDAVDTNQWPQSGYSYDSVAFQKAIARFIALKDDTLGKNIRFYPIIAAHEAFGPGAIESVQTAFKISSQVPPLVSPLAYTFTVGKSLFIVFSVAQTAESTPARSASPLNPKLLKWLEDTLKEHRKNYDFVFVAGNQPAFSTTAATAEYQGLDAKVAQRDLFWRILVENRVTAYFCSQEHLYDRTNRSGVWQIISGGGGAPFYKREFDKAFYHYLLLTLPTKDQKFPRIHVYDAQGNLIDEFQLVPSQYPVYQLRISSK